MEPQTRKSLCNTVEYVLDYIPKEFAETALSAAQSEKPQDWEAFWLAVNKLEKALSVYDKLDCRRIT